MKLHTTLLLSALVLSIAMQTNALFGQDRYPLLFEEMSAIDQPVQYSRHSSRSTPVKSVGFKNAILGNTKSVAPKLQPSFFTAQAGSASNNTDEDEEEELPDPSDMNGNSIITNRVSFQNWGYNTNGFADYVVPGRLYIGDNNSAQTDNRLIFRTNFFKNALGNSLTNGSGTTYDQTANIDEYLFGFEKTLDENEQWSFEMRMPLYGSNDEVFADGFATQNLSVGNLAMILKRQMFEDETRVLSAGLGLSVPTGDDNSFIVGEEIFTVRNDATYVAPFIAGLWTPNDKWFYHSFLTVDVPASSNTIEYRDLMPCGCPGGVIGQQTNQTLLNFDVAAGYWLFRCRNQSLITAMSSMVELHYTTPLNDADVVSANTAYNYVEFGSTGGNTFDSVNMTAGFDFNILNRLNLRVATVVPLNDGFDRFFDSEWQTSINFLR